MIDILFITATSLLDFQQRIYLRIAIRNAGFYPDDKFAIVNHFIMNPIIL